MTSPKQFELIMREIGPRVEGAQEVSRLEDGSFVVRFDEVDVCVSLADELGRVMLAARVGVPPADLRERIYETALLYATLWRDTGGVRTTLDERGGALTQMVDLNLANVTTDLLAIVLHNLNERTLIWRKLVEGYAETSSDRLELHENIIKV